MHCSKLQSISKLPHSEAFTLLIVGWNPKGLEHPSDSIIEMVNINRIIIVSELNW